MKPHEEIDRILHGILKSEAKPKTHLSAKDHVFLDNMIRDVECGGNGVFIAKLNGSTNWMIANASLTEAAEMLTAMMTEVVKRIKEEEA